MPDKLTQLETHSGKHVFHFKCFAAQNEIQIDGLSRERAATIADKMVAEALRIEAKYSRYRSDSVTSKINASAGISSIKVDQETAVLLNYADLAYKSSSGAFDITAGVLRKVWDFKLARLPTQQQLDGALALIGWNRVRWNGEELSLPLAGMELDFGAIGKEYAVDRCAELASLEGAKNCCVNFAGDLRVTGTRADGTPWIIGIQHPRVLTSTIASIPLSSGALATSGDYERYFELNDERYCHILDARSGNPVKHFQSVSILAENCLSAGTFATIAMLLGRESLRSLLAPGALPYLIIDQQGEILSNASRGIN